MSSELELEILNLIIKFKPAGLHKNFRMFNILLNSTLVSMEEIQEIIQKYYDLSQVSVETDYLLAEREFLLPDYDFASIIEEYRLQAEDDLSREVSPQRTNISGPGSKRDSTSSQSNQLSASGSASGKRRTRNTTNKREKRKRATHKS